MTIVLFDSLLIIQCGGFYFKWGIFGIAASGVQVPNFPFGWFCFTVSINPRLKDEDAN
ncbi:hypothetical protein [Sphaerospermopsis sp. LEGE 08334]|uniref:hypothetical protein n=1 Tax=Sphaerospermopsis sp. LEGE 08334 TaxID=1828651 RepID=UPI00187F3A2A|nr:hypothetical protein [Sphaerospermopsis sp. LEGE 08334]MBE9056339.1 hypothetical protein [Sphaerospermopsis sp. LEGE 08334]